MAHVLYSHRPPCSSVAAAFFALIVVLGVATPAGAARELQAKAPKELIKKYGFPQKLYLDQLPGAAILNPKGEVPAISITMVPATFTVGRAGRLLGWHGPWPVVQQSRQPGALQAAAVLSAALRIGGALTPEVGFMVFHNMQTRDCYFPPLCLLPIQGPTNGPKLFTYTGMAYVDDNTGIAGVRGQGSSACRRMHAAMPPDAPRLRLRMCTFSARHVPGWSA
jgi:hypothetical protein